MRKIGVFAVATALSLAAIGGWVASSTQARPEPSKDIRIDPTQIMTHAEGLPVQHVADFSVVFE
jgi:hypothetical protein